MVAVETCFEMCLAAHTVAGGNILEVFFLAVHVVVRRNILEVFLAVHTVVVGNILDVR